MQGKLTKRIVRILTIETARNTCLTYEKEPSNSRKNSHFYKTNTNHPGFPAAVAHATSVKWDILERVKLVKLAMVKSSCLAPMESAIISED
jgi:hypothetical protein